MDASVSSRLDRSLNNLLSDEENQSDASLSPAPPQVHTQQESVAESPGVTVVQLADGETLEVKRSIPAPQASVIQAPQVHTVQVATAAELEEDESTTDALRRREVLSRRPSYRKILNELASDSPAVPKIDEEETEDEEEEEEEEVSNASTIYQTSSGQYITVTQDGAIQLSSRGGQALQGSQNLTQPGATILQCAAQPGDAPQQFYIQGGQVLLQAATGDIPAYQLRSPNSGLTQSIVMAASPGSMQSPPPHRAEEVTRKREVRLMKNREAARECRRKKKEYVKCLENRVAVLENQNKTLIEELKALKDIYCHKNE
ncbi:cAMP-responsive element modulator isoform X2 [Limanda limanda]|uniref:cAMP-responsive element modulator isoform X2 n=1 Tax=Limanda limanda TaxID=27771 RepID=UPI0029C753AE|nr:cAMP-responsive element modulator isoform X2 [Limanda limanda]